MDSLFRVYLNGVFIEDEPMGLNETELTITRDETLNGVFFSFTSELIFWGDGYDALKAIRDTLAGCSQIPCNIEYKCSETEGYEVLYEGIIPLGSDQVEWDDYNCKVTSRIENADFSNFLQTYGDFVFKVNDAFCIDNSTALTSITENATELFTGFSGAFTGTGIKTYLFTDVLGQILKYLSNNEITLNADTIYSTLFMPQKLDFDFIDPIVAGDIIEITWTNYYGQNYTVSYTALGGGFDIQTAMQYVAYMELQNVTSDQLRTNFMQKGGHVDTTNYIVTNHVPWSAYAVSVNSGAKVATVTETQAFQYGLKNLAVTTATCIKSLSADVSITLNQLLEHTSQMHNMGFRLVKTATGYDFELKYYPDMIVNTDTQILLAEVTGIKAKASGTFNVNSIRSPQGEADNIFKPFSWDTENCFGDNKKIEGSRFSTQEFFSILNVSETQEDDPYFLFLRDSDYGFAQGYEFSLDTANSFFNDLYHYNGPYFMPLIVSRHLINAGEKDLNGQIPMSVYENIRVTCSNCPTAVIVNTNTKVLRYVYDFDYPLSFEQVNTLITQSLNYISFSDGRNLSRQGFLKEVTIPFKNFIASFQVYAE